MNEAVRNISVKTEIASEPLMREHLRVMHYNNGQYIKKPINVNRAGIAMMIYPSALKCDVDFRLKITIDKDYKPKRLAQLINILQILTNTKSQHPDQLQISILPIVQEIARALNVPADQLIQPARAMPQQSMAQQQGGGMDPNALAALMGQGGAPSGTVQTPVGNILASPQGAY